MIKAFFIIWAFGKNLFGMDYLEISSPPPIPPRIVFDGALSFIPESVALKYLIPYFNYRDYEHLSQTSKRHKGLCAEQTQNYAPLIAWMRWAEGREDVHSCKPSVLALNVSQAKAVFDDFMFWKNTHSIYREIKQYEILSSVFSFHRREIKASRILEIFPRFQEPGQRMFGFNQAFEHLIILVRTIGWRNTQTLVLPFLSPEITITDHDHTFWMMSDILKKKTYKKLQTFLNESIQLSRSVDEKRVSLVALWDLLSD